MIAHEPLYGAPGRQRALSRADEVRDLLIQLAHMGLIKAKWSVDIHQEWIESYFATSRRVTELRSSALATS